MITQSVLSYSLYGLYINIDRGILEKSGPSGSVAAVRGISKEMNSLQSGDIKQYLLLFLISGLGIFFFLTFCQSPVLTFACFASFISNLDDF